MRWLSFVYSSKNIDSEKNGTWLKKIHYLVMGYQCKFSFYFSFNCLKIEHMSLFCLWKWFCDSKILIVKILKSYYSKRFIFILILRGYSQMQWHCNTIYGWFFWWDWKISFALSSLRFLIFNYTQYDFSQWHFSLLLRVIIYALYKIMYIYYNYENLSAVSFHVGLKKII